MTVSIDYAERRRVAMAACGELGVATVLVFAPGSSPGMNTQAQGYMSYLSGWDAIDSPSVLVLGKGRRPWLLVASRSKSMMASEMLTDIDIEWAGGADFAAKIGATVASGGEDGAPIGACGWDEMPAGIWRAIEAGLTGRRRIDVAPALAALRRVKDAAQIALHEKGAALCDRMFAGLADMAVAGRPTHDIKAEMELTARRQGVEYVGAWMTAGDNPDYPRYDPPENRQVARTGEYLLGGVMMVMGGVWAHAVRSFHVGPFDERRGEIQDAVVDFQRCVVDAMVPGRDLAQVIAEAYGRLDDLYRGVDIEDVRMLRLGHGLGCSYSEPGVSEPFPLSFHGLEDVAPGTEAVILEPGMVFEIHPMFLFKGGGAAVGDMVLIEDGGARFLTAFPRALQALGG
ncbi:MAG: M24 family metallopeptidase [Rhodospirillales bacterium]|jgi:Xaa-Pro aminopeptidase|nr:M24 family metallopeptidase [Rhodospirillales bacterium]MDP6884663.1 M24 family metallopeptidase [Rhodospirillales bacterium]